MFDFVLLNEILASGLMPRKCWHFLVYRECFDLLLKDKQNKTCFYQFKICGFNYNYICSNLN
jgi:hypothetical protein